MNLDPEYQLSRLQERAARGRSEYGAGFRAWTFRALGVLLVVLRDIAFGQLTLRAMSLVYTTLLSIVPLLALSFSVLKAFGVHNQIEPALARFLEPLGERGDEITAQIIQFIGNINVGVLGALGLGLLLYTAISLIQKIEVSFNFIWHVQEPRNFGTRFSSYLSVLLVGPLIVFSALGITAAATSIGVVRDLLAIEPFGRIAVHVGKVVPYALIVGLFTFIYIYIPNTKVRWGAALGGALVGGIAWQTAGWAFANFVARSASYTAIYSGFAILIFFMIWVYVSWLIVLIGSSVAFYIQHGEYVVVTAGEPALSSRMRERLALLVMLHVAQRHVTGAAPLGLQELSRTLQMPSYAVRQALDLLVANAMLMPTRTDPTTWLPLREISAISAKQVVDAVRSDGETPAFGVDALRLPDPLQTMMENYEQASAEVLARTSLRDAVSDAAQSDSSLSDSPLNDPPADDFPLIEQSLNDPPLTDPTMK